MWLEDGLQFIVYQAKEFKLAKLLGLRVCSIYQVLEALNFECLEEQSNYSIYRHHCFIRGNVHMIEQIINYSNLGEGKKFAMPSIAYSSELRPLEVRLNLSDSKLQSWEVTIAPSVLSHPTTLDICEDFLMQEKSAIRSSSGECLWGNLFSSSDEWSDHDMNSPLWWSQQSDFSSICTDDLSDMDALSQISVHYG